MHIVVWFNVRQIVRFCTVHRLVKYSQGDMHSPPKQICSSKQSCSILQFLIDSNVGLSVTVMSFGIMSVT